MIPRTNFRFHDFALHCPEGSPTGSAPSDDDYDDDKPKGKKRITCDFCESILAPSGDVLKLSAVARSYRDAADKIVSVEVENKTLKARIAELELEVSSLKKGTPPDPAPDKKDPSKGY